MSPAETSTQLVHRPEPVLDGLQALQGSSSAWVAGQRIGPFKLQRLLGEGGMGRVWLAQQITPLVRDVALKVMLQTQRSARAEAYFEVERQALAQLSHRAIAQIFDAGRLPEGALFFAMEYVEGLPLDQFLREQGLGPEAVSRLFVEVCAGIQHAHQRGLIHRDLKPQNVLVQRVGGEPAPKIIDFGIALGANPDGDAAVRQEQVAGTPAYMSPEQRSPGATGIDARTDIYALGVMLAEALYRLAGADYSSEPDAGSKLREALTQGSSGHRRGPGDSGAARARQLQKLPLELRAIALKAMSTDRELRYASAAAMAEDLQRWLRHEPVSALAASRGYTLRCFLRRNALASAAAALIGLAMLTGTVLALYGMAQARAGRSEAELALALAEQRRSEGEELIQFMLGDFADKLRPIGRLDLLDSVGARALAHLGGEDNGASPESTLARARALRTLGEVQVTRQQFDRAEETLLQAARILQQTGAERGELVTEMTFESAQVSYWRGLISFRIKRLEQAEQHWQDYLRSARQLTDAGPQADPRGEQELAYALNNLGSLALAAQRFEDALGYFGQVVTLRERSPLSADDPTLLDHADSISWMASAQMKLGQPRAASATLQRALALVQDYRSLRGDADQRRQEINLRLKLGQLHIDLAEPAIALGWLKPALARAQADVALDPSQPRRQRLLAELAFELSLLAPAASSTGISDLKTGLAAAATAPIGQLTADDRNALELLACRARLHHADSGAQACAQALVPAIHDTLQSGPFDSALFEAWAQLLSALPEGLRADRASLAGSALDRIATAPQAQRGSLGFLLRELTLLDLASHPLGKAQALQTRIALMRSAPERHP